jgi:ferredoxin
MPSNYIVFSGAESKKKQHKKISAMKDSVKTIVSVVTRKENHYENGSIIFRLLGGSFLHRLFASHAASSDKKFTVDSTCNGCGVCEKICLVKNIKLNKKRLVWKHHCEQCFACIQWCPCEAIQYEKKQISSS